jgi:RNA polymerase sigma factor (sigma-70 family)
LTRHALNQVVVRLRSRARIQGDAVLTDGELLECYLAHRDESAFAALVERHGPMVLAVCRRIADNLQDAEDAFQATFLVLVRKAATIRPRHKVGNWLYGVAYRAGMKVRALAHRQRSRQMPMNAVPQPVTIESGLWDDLLPKLDAELHALPEKYRLPIVLCDLEGKTRREAARSLAWPEGTVAGRLAQGRALLAKRLTKKGLPVSAGMLAALMAHNAASASLPATLASTLVQALGASAARAGTVGVSAKVAAVADGVLKMMLVSKLKSMLAIPALVTALALAAAYSMQGDRQEAVGAPVVPANPEASEPEPVVWGQPVDGLQMGIRFEPAAKRSYRPGDTATLVVLVRNAGDKPLPVHWKITSGGPLFPRSGLPLLEDANGKFAPVYKQNIGYNRVLMSGRLLDPGAECELGRPQISIVAEPPTVLAERPAVALPPGKYQVHYRDAAWKTNLPIGPGLITPKIELEITAAQPAQGQPRQVPLQRDPQAMAAAVTLKALTGTWLKAQLEIDGRPNARFVSIEPYYAFDGDRFTITDHEGNVERKGTIKVAPFERMIDLHVTHGADKGTTLLLRYDLQDDQLRLAFSDFGKTRPKEMKTVDGSGIAIYTFRRVAPLDDTDRRALQGTWNVVGQVTDGKEVTKEYLELNHQWTFADNTITKRDREGITRIGTFLLYASTKPPSLDLHVHPRTDTKQERFHAIYLIKGDTLNVCYSNASSPERPTKLLSTFESNTTVVTLRRHRPQEMTEQELEKLAGLWHIVGNGHPGGLTLNVQKNGQLDGHIYTQRLSGEYDARTGHVVINRHGSTQSTIGKAVQIYTGEFVRGTAKEPACFLKGTFSVVGGPSWGEEGKAYEWKAVRYKDHLKTVSIGAIMKDAHLTPGNRATKDNLDTKVMDGRATKLEQQQLLELYEELARRKPPKGDGKAWKERTEAMVCAVEGVIAGAKDASARLLEARDCKACHDAHRPATLLNKSKPDHHATVGGPFQPGNKMFTQVVDFLAGPMAPGAGCPSAMIADAKTPGVIIWARTDGDPVFELAALLEKSIDGKRTKGFLVVFDKLTKFDLTNSADYFGLHKLRIGVPRQLREEIKQFERAATAGADTVAFVVDGEAIRGAWAFNSEMVGRDRLAVIADEVARMVAPQK